MCQASIRHKTAASKQPLLSYTISILYSFCFLLLTSLCQLTQKKKLRPLVAPNKSKLLENPMIL